MEAKYKYGEKKAAAKEYEEQEEVDKEEKEVGLPGRYV